MQKFAFLRRLALLASLGGPFLFAQPAYDVLLRGGHVLDPKNNINRLADVAIAGGKVAAVGPNLDAKLAKKVIDVKGLYVSPGFIDLHVHVFFGDGPSYSDGKLSVLPDDHSFRNGVTTMVDAGTAGWRNFDIFKTRIIDRSKTRVLSWVNIVGAGMGGAVEQNTEDMGPAAVTAIAKKHPGVIVGVKTAHYAGHDWLAVDNAVKAASDAGIPVMVDFGVFHLERPHEDLVLKHLRPGDMYTHLYLPWVPMFSEQNGKPKLRPYLLEARKRGVLFDVGHGSGSFVFRYAAPAVAQGFAPDTISTDLHTSSMLGGMMDMPNVMSKFLNLGMSLADVIKASTWVPAKTIHREDLGHLSVGSVADITVFQLEKGSFGFVDVYGARLPGTQRIAAELTFKDGLLHWDRNGLTRQNWDSLGKYNALGDPLWDRVVSPGVRNRR